MIKKEWHIFLTAVMFYTCVRVPKNINHSANMLNAATKYLPVIGILVGLFCTTIFYVAEYVLNNDIAVLLSIIAGIILTGALHEDGLADTCDGFGGGWSKQKILLIMKDSSSGAFGVIGIASALLLKYTSLSNIPFSLMAATLISAHSLSRWCCTLIITFGEYARDDETSKSKPVAKKMKPQEVMTATLFAISSLLLFKQWQVILVIPVLLAATYLLYRYFKKWIDGYTGDCLGATQQVTEILVYLTCILLWKFI